VTRENINDDNEIIIKAAIITFLFPNLSDKNPIRKAAIIVVIHVIGPKNAV